MSERAPWVFLLSAGETIRPRTQFLDAQWLAGRAFVAAGVAAPLAVPAAPIPKESSTDASVVPTMTFEALREPIGELDMGIDLLD